MKIEANTKIKATDDILTRAPALHSPSQPVLHVTVTVKFVPYVASAVQFVLGQVLVMLTFLTSALDVQAPSLNPSQQYFSQSFVHLENVEEMKEDICMFDAVDAAGDGVMVLLVLSTEEVALFDCSCDAEGVIEADIEAVIGASIEAVDDSDAAIAVIDAVTSAVDSDTACEDVTDTSDETEEDSTDTLEDSGARDTLIEASNDIVAVGVSVDDGAVDAVVGVGASVSMDVVVL